jgi:hypothetical protein
VVKWIKLIEVNKSAVVDIVLEKKAVRGKAGNFHFGITL